MKLRIALAMVVVGGCAMGAPPGFSQGSTWTLPLVDPLADGRLVTALYVEGKGPYLVAIDPDAPVTVLDGNIIAAGGFPASSGPREIDESDTGHPMFRAVVTNLRIGDLAISQRTVLVARHDAFAGDGREILGVLGRDVIADSLAFGFDRDRGIAWLQTQDTFKPPSDAVILDYFKGNHDRGDLVVRRLVHANVDGKSVVLHLDLGAAQNQLLVERGSEARLELVPKTATLIDEFGGRREVHVAGVASRVTVGGVKADRIAFVPYADKRWDFGQLDGTLGLEFFRPYAVIADWHHERYLLGDRHDTPQSRDERLARWGDAIPASCRSTGCATVAIEVIDGQTIAHVKRDPAAAGKPLELVVRATGAGALANLSVNLPANTDEVAAGVEAAYASAKLEVADASPFPYQCDNGCVLGEAPR